MLPNTVLSRLKGGESARVAEVSGAMRRRLQDLGLIPGTVVECLGPSPLGDPCAYIIRGAVIALRKADAAAIQISPPFSSHLASQRALTQQEAGYGTL